MPWILLVLLQDKVAAEEGIRISVSGSVEFDFVSREGPLQETRSALNDEEGGATEQFFLGWTTLRFDVALPNQLSAAVELGHWSSDDEADLPWGANPELTDLFLLEGYLELQLSKVRLRAGVQPFGYRLRPQGEAFFLDVNDSELFYAGATTFVRNTADRQVLTPAGAHLRWEFFEFGALEVFWAHTKNEDGDENLFAALLNGLLSERIAYDFVVAFVSGGEAGRVVTVGLGIDAYPAESRWLELFGEFFGQFGRLAPGVRKTAWAANAGARAHGRDFWVEAAFAFRSGDADPEDGSDGGFQSYESTAQFAIVESAMYGMDVDTNVWSPRASAAWRPHPRAELRVDLADFRFHRFVREESGARLSDEKHLGVEIDFTASWEIGAAVVRLRAAFLAASDFVDDLTGSRTIWLVAPEIAVTF